MWVVSKKESNYVLENKMVSTLIWRHISLLYVVQSNILWLTILLSYHYRCNVVFTNYRVPVSFLLYIATKKLNQTITVNSSTNTPITKKITLARFACLCCKTTAYQGTLQYRIVNCKDLKLCKGSVNCKKILKSKDA